MYTATMLWFPGACFLLSSIITVIPHCMFWFMFFHEKKMIQNNKQVIADQVVNP
jgi:protein-S-isoprenylcysteine O-methyltransferase Ste14